MQKKSKRKNLEVSCEIGVGSAFAETKRTERGDYSGLFAAIYHPVSR